MNDEEIAKCVNEAATKFCDALNTAGKAGLQIEVAFASSAGFYPSEGPCERTGWYGGATLRRVVMVKGK